MTKHEKTPEELFAEQFVKQLQPKTVEDVENGLKSIFRPIFESRNALSKRCIPSCLLTALYVTETDFL